MRSGAGEQNVERLRSAGVIAGELPQEYYQAFEELTDDEVDLIVSVKGRLDRIHQELPDLEDWAAFVPF
jgi:hypothetical protein